MVSFLCPSSFRGGQLVSSCRPLSLSFPSFRLCLADRNKKDWVSQVSEYVCLYVVCSLLLFLEALVWGFPRKILLIHSLRPPPSRYPKDFVPDGLAEEVITPTSVAAMLSATGCQIDVSELGNSRDIASLIAGFMNWMLAKIRMEKSGGSDAAQAAAAQATKATAAPVRVAATASSSDTDKEEAVKLNTKKINASFVKRPPRSFEIQAHVDYPECPIKHYCAYLDHDLPYTEERTLGRLETVARLMVDGYVLYFIVDWYCRPLRSHPHILSIFHPPFPAGSIELCRRKALASPTSTCWAWRTS